MNKKLADSQTAEPVLAYTTRASATVAAQLPVFDAADPAASRHTSPRLPMIIKYAPVQQRPRSLHATRGNRDCQHTSKAQDPGYTRNDRGRKREAVTTHPEVNSHVMIRNQESSERGPTGRAAVGLAEASLRNAAARPKVSPIV